MLKIIVLVFAAIIAAMVIKFEIINFRRHIYAGLVKKDYENELNGIESFLLMLDVVLWIIYFHI